MSGETQALPLDSGSALRAWILVTSQDSHDLCFPDSTSGCRLRLSTSGLRARALGLGLEVGSPPPMHC